MLSFSLLFCVSEPCPLSSLLRKTGICHRGCDIRRKGRHEGTPDIQTYPFAVLKKRALHANVSHWISPGPGVGAAWRAGFTVRKGSREKRGALHSPGLGTAGEKEAGLGVQPGLLAGGALRGLPGERPTATVSRPLPGGVWRRPSPRPVPPAGHMKAGLAATWSAGEAFGAELGRPLRWAPQGGPGWEPAGHRRDGCGGQDAASAEGREGAGARPGPRSPANTERRQCGPRASRKLGPSALPPPSQAQATL